MKNSKTSSSKSVRFNQPEKQNQKEKVEEKDEAYVEELKRID